MQFKDIIGQEEVKRRLVQTVKENRISHAQLFFGPEGSGKLALAIAYGQFINCRNKLSGENDKGDALEDSCGTCPSCIKYSKLIHPDLHFIYPVATTKEVTKNPVSKEFLKTWRQVLTENDFRLSLNDWYEAIGIEKKQGIINAEDCSEILRTLSYKSYESEYKVMIIWMVEKLFHSAAPKILKILEEPPDKTLFILISEKTDQIISTILSRTQMVKISRLKDEDILKLLTEKHNCSEEQALQIVPLVEGNYTKAVKIFRQDEDELQFFGDFVRWMRLCWSDKYVDTLPFISEIAKTGREQQKSFLAYASRIIRNGMLVHYALPQLARMNDEEKKWMITKFSSFITHDNLLVFVEEFEQAQYHIERNANPNILFADLSLTITSLLKMAGAKR